jgi:PKD repeat protein
VYEMFDEAELSSNAYAPLVEKDHAGFDSYIGVSNMSDVAATVAITFHDPAGGVVSTWSEQMSPRGSVELNVDTIAALPGGFVGSASIQAEQPILVQVNRSNEMALASYTAPAQGGSELAAPLVAGALPGVITASVALQNIGGQPTVVAEAYGEGCDTCLCRIVNLDPGGSDFVTRPYTTSIPLYIFNDDESPVASVVTIDSLEPGEAGSAVYAAFDVARLGNRSAVPLAFGGYEEWYTQVWVQNLGTTTTTAYLTYTLSPTPGTSSILPVASAEVGPRQTVAFAPPPAAHASAIAWADQPIAVLVTGHNDSLGLEDSSFAYRGMPYGSPLARFSDDAPVRLGDTVYFYNSSVAVPPVRYQWDFGDASVSAKVNPAHTYATSGAYTVTLTATNFYGESTFGREIEIYGPPQASFESASPTDLGQPSYFVNTSTGLPAPHSYEWDFSDGGFSNAENPVHYFESAGRHWIILTAHNTLGNDTFVAWVDVWDTQYVYLPVITRSGP